MRLCLQKIIYLKDNCFGVQYSQRSSDIRDWSDPAFFLAWILQTKQSHSIFRSLAFLYAFLSQIISLWYIAVPTAFLLITLKETKVLEWHFPSSPYPRWEIIVCAMHFRIMNIANKMHCYDIAGLADNVDIIIVTWLFPYYHTCTWVRMVHIPLEILGRKLTFRMFVARVIQ